MENERKNSALKFYKIFLFILPIIVLIIIFSSQISLYITDLGKTSPEKVLEYTHGEFSISPRQMVSAEEELKNFAIPVKEETSNFKINYSFESPRFEYNYNFYDSETEYYESCGGKKTIINFTEPTYRSFRFNYTDKTFTYTLPVYRDLYYFSDNLKNQDCYYQTEKYSESYLKDPYNNYFVDGITQDLLKLQEQGYSKNQLVEIATLFVQSIEYGTDSTELNRYPAETIYEQTGNCLDKTIILVEILKNLNYTSYIFTGKSGDEYHALAGVGCDQGNINYNNQDLCFIETTVFSPIGEESDINIDNHILVSSGLEVYTDKNYGYSLLQLLNSKVSNAQVIESQMIEIERQQQDYREKMCQTDCEYCDSLYNIQPIFCDDADIYNRYVYEYNKLIDQYNLLVERWYVPWFESENLMFNNQQYVERT